jgi:predicted nuclease of restriction endonuclease-like (RecB) superfamily
MSNLPAKSLRDYADLLGQVKSRIRQAQTKAILSANAEMIRLYWEIGRLIHLRQRTTGWGAFVIPKLATDLRNELPEVKGFSERNIKQMLGFYRAYREPSQIVQQAVAQLPPSPKVPQLVALIRHSDSLLWLIPWGHHAHLLEKVKDFNTRIWYMEQTLKNGWSRNILSLMIKSQAHQRQGKAITNFAEQLPPAQSDLVLQALKDPYIFDFLTLEEPFHERELETQLLHHLEKFLIELGQGFAFVGRQYPVVVGDEDFYIDLLFYHLHLRCFIVIDLKKGAFKAEYAGKMNFYLNVIDDKLRHPGDRPSVGLILCQDRNRVVAEYALRGMKKPIGISEYELTRALPKELRSSLPTIEQIEAELTGKTNDVGGPRPLKSRKLPKRRGRR